MQDRRALTRRAQGEACLRGQGCRLRAGGRGAIREEIVVGHDGRDLLAAGRLEVAHRGEVSRPPFGPRQGAVRHLLDQPWTKAYWPRSGERGSTSRRTTSRRTNPHMRPSMTAASVPLMAARPALVNESP